MTHYFKVSLLVCILCIALGLADRHQIPTFTVSGTPYEVGKAIGARFAGQISARVSADEPLQKLIEYAKRDHTGKQYYNRLVNAAKAKYPSHLEEIRGMADGSEIDMATLVVLNIRAELGILRSGSEGSAEEAWSASQHCSDVLVKRPGVALVGHNEDDAPGSDGYLVTSTYKADSGKEKSFTAYIIPGELATSAFGFNSKVAFSQNALYTTRVEADGLGRNFVSRALLEAQTVKEAISVITQDSIALGHNYNIMDLTTKDIVNVETLPGHVSSVWRATAASQFKTKYAVEPVVNGWLFHANMYHHTELNPSEPPEPSSEHREKTAASLPAPVDRAGVLNILGDATDRDYPIFRRAEPGTADTGFTVVTALFDLDAMNVCLYTRNPKLHPEDCISVPLGASEEPTLV